MYFIQKKKRYHSFGSQVDIWLSHVEEFLVKYFIPFAFMLLEQDQEL